MIRILDLFFKKNETIIDYMRKDNRSVVVWDIDEFVNAIGEVRGVLIKEEKKGKPMTVVTTNAFQQKLIGLYDNREDDLIEMLSEILLDLCNISVGGKFRNQSITNVKGYNELHISGDVLLLYKYEGDILTLELRLTRIVKHIKLNKLIIKRWIEKK